MIKLVETKEENELFEEIYKIVAGEKNFIIEEKGDNVIRYLFFEGNNAIGTMEFVPYNPQVFTTVEHEFSFINLPEIKKHKDKTWEVDKVGFLPNYRKRGHVQLVIDCIMHHHTIYNNTYAICLFDEKFYRLLRILHRQYDIKQVGETFVVKGEIEKTVPATIHMPTVYHVYQESGRKPNVKEIVKI